MCNMNADGNRYKCSMENFIMDEYSICREERQYAVFLYNILRKYGKKQAREELAGEERDTILKILEACGIEADDDIEYVFYEATFMRDFFERERRYSAARKYDSNKVGAKLLQKTYANDTKWENIGDDAAEKCFNYQLIRYVHEHDEDYGQHQSQHQARHQNKMDENLKAILRYNLGHTPIPGRPQIEGARLNDREKEKIKDMMNAKPDIAVIYRGGSDEDDEEKNYLLFIECKFESYEDSYDGENLSQCSVQYDVAGFLCDYLNKNNLMRRDPLDDGPACQMAVSLIMESDHKSRMVKFMRTDGNEKRSANKQCSNEKERNARAILMIQAAESPYRIERFFQAVIFRSDGEFSLCLAD